VRGRRGRGGPGCGADIDIKTHIQRFETVMKIQYELLKPAKIQKSFFRQSLNLL